MWGDIFQMSLDRHGVVEIPIVARDLITMSNPDRFVADGGCERWGKSFEGKTDGGDDEGVDFGERRRRYRRLEMRFDAVYEWKGLKLEVDETDFGFRTLYEIKCKSSDPEEAKKLIEEIEIFLGKVKEGKENPRKCWDFTLVAFW